MSWHSHNFSKIVCGIPKLGQYQTHNYLTTTTPTGHLLISANPITTSSGRKCAFGAIIKLAQFYEISLMDLPVGPPEYRNWGIGIMRATSFDLRFLCFYVLKDNVPDQRLLENHVDPASISQSPRTELPVSYFLQVRQWFFLRMIELWLVVPDPTLHWLSWCISKAYDTLNMVEFCDVTLVYPLFSDR